jgi:hypothetical protein
MEAPQLRCDMQGLALPDQPGSFLQQAVNT